jgi:ubiquinone/menaquinone biosynthesis C-methylase UbiE
MPVRDLPTFRRKFKESAQKVRIPVCACECIENPSGGTSFAMHNFCGVICKVLLVIPAAEAIGPSGFVIGIDLADKLLELAWAEAERRLLKNVSFLRADMLALDYPVESFDAVICVFGILFVPDMPSAVRELWRFICPGGRLAITTWGSQLLEPANAAFWQAIQKVRPDLHRAFHPQYRNQQLIAPTPPC